MCIKCWWNIPPNNKAYPKEGEANAIVDPNTDPIEMKHWTWAFGIVLCNQTSWTMYKYLMTVVKSQQMTWKYKANEDVEFASLK